MTVKELYEWAIDNNCLNAELYAYGSNGKRHGFNKAVLSNNKEVYLNKVYEKNYSDTYWR